MKRRSFFRIVLGAVLVALVPRPIRTEVRRGWILRADDS